MQNIREKLKKVKNTEPEGETFPMNNGPQWSCGNDVPITWDSDELKRIKRRTLRNNWKRGVISKKVYKVMLNGRYT